ncbi:MAG: GerMN domain-containing protein [Clostridiales bacterium]|nr:GerMN domain-containing protein [Clostridiales bacterium]
MDRRWKRLGCLMAAALLLSGCVGQEKAPGGPQLTLPPAEKRYEAPENDINQGYEQTVLLYLPSLEGTQLLAYPVKAQFSASRHNAQTLCEMLLSQPSAGAAQAVGGDVTLTLSGTDAVEVSGQVATVSLGASALRLSHEQLYLVGQALANTLCQFGDLQYVNVLIAGVQPGLNVASTLPAGAFQPNTREDLSTLWARAGAPATAGRRSFAAAVYFPAPAGKGILCEGRTLSFSSQDLPGMAVTLLEAIGAGAEKLPNAPACPRLREMLADSPVLEETGGVRRLSLHFREEMNSALIDAGITRSVMMAAMTYTFTTFLPGLDGIEVVIGEESITSLTPSGTYSGAGEQIRFADGLMRRRDFSGFLLAECALYFSDGNGRLTRVLRPVPFYEAYSARALVQLLLLGPQPFDSVSGLRPVLPQGLRPADLLGVSYADQALVLNFSDQWPILCEGMDAAAEKQMIYALVNTLCELQGVKKAAFFVQGEQPDSLAGHIYLPGDFLPNPDLVTP